MTRRRRGPLWVRVLAGFAGGAVLAVVLLVAWLAYELNGGWPVPETDPDDPRVDEAHVRWTPVVDGRRAALVTDLEAHGLVVLAVNETDSCREGQNNWKIQDGYGLQCSLTWRVVLGAPAGEPTGLVASVQDVLDSHGLEGWSDADGRTRTLLTRMEDFEPDDERVASVSYVGRLEAHGEAERTHLSVDLARVPSRYTGDRVLFTSGELREVTGPSVRDLQAAEREWLSPAGRREATPWLLTVSEQVPYFTR